LLIRTRMIQVMFSFLLLFAVLTAAVGYHQLIRGPELARQAVAMRSKKIELNSIPGVRFWIVIRSPLPVPSHPKQSTFYSPGKHLSRKISSWLLMGYPMLWVT
jgi:hypothetical protein